MNSKTGKVLLIMLIVLAIVAGVSFMPLEKWSGGRIKDFNLLSDILPDSLLGDSSSSGREMTVDPALLKAEQEEAAVAATLDANGNPIYSDSIVAPVKPSLRGDTVVIEDYTTGDVGLYHMRKAIADGRLARIAVVGDSYIEGDIMTQNLRENLQSKYGGAGTGYMNMHSDFPGFRRSVRQGGEGWKEYKAGKKAASEYVGLSEQYFMPTGNALATYKGSTQLKHVDSWTRSQFLFIAPNSTTIMTKTTGDWVEHPVTGDPTRVQAITVDGATTEFDVRTADKSLIALGVWLDGNKGVAVDCMSSRGYSGVTLTKVNATLCRQMAKWVDYDLIVLEFGINAMTAKQTDYSVYANKLVQVINHVKQCYPSADILLMGIGDRGEKRNGTVVSMSTAPYMIEAQRTAARRAHCLFWDTRQAMGGDGAIVEWSKQGHANKDYIHLTHSGGARLAAMLSNAITLMMK